MLFAVIAAAGAAASDVYGGAPAPAPPRNTLTVSVSPWRAGPYPDLLLDTPELASCLHLATGWWGLARVPSAAPDAAALAAAVRRQLEGVLPFTPGTLLTVVVAEGSVKVPQAVVSGGTGLLLLPTEPAVSAEDAARTVARAVVLSRTAEAAPDARCGEPLLTLAEALVDAGSYALAALPAALRPVHDWLDVKEAAPVLEALAEEALDPEVPWRTRRARLATVGSPGGAAPAVGHAAALVLEAFGDPGAARSRPFDVLLAWRNARPPTVPRLPRALRSALSLPLTAGIPKRDDADEDRRAIELDALSRALAAGEVPPPPRGPVPVTLRLAAAANARAAGRPSVCDWLRDAALPPGLDTGCREQGEEGGFVYARPDRHGGAEVVSRSADGDEALLLRWPRWLLFPAVSRPGGELFFIDAEGVWSVPLDGGAPPRRVLAGSFRFLALAPGGTRGAAVRWPEGTVTTLDGATPASAAVRATGGLAWLQPELLLASDRDTLTVVSLDGEARPWPRPVPCVCSLTAAGSAVLAGVTAPCTPALARLSLAGTAQDTLAILPDGPVGIVPRPRGAVCFGSADGLWLRTADGSVERIGAGLTPGPG